MPKATLSAVTFAAAAAVASALDCSRSVEAAIPAAAGALSVIGSSPAKEAVVDAMAVDDLVPMSAPRANAARPEVHWFARPHTQGSTVLYVANYYAGTVDVLPEGQPSFMMAQIVHLGAPTGLAVDARGNLYVAEMARHDVLEFPPDLSAVIRNFAVGGTSGNGNGLPLGVAVSPDGRKLYVADAERNGAVEVFAPPKRTAVQVLRNPSLAEGAVYPALDTAGNVYVTYRTSPPASGTFGLGIFAPDGAFQTAKLPGNPIAVVPDGNGNLLVDNFYGANSSSLWTYTPDAKIYPAEFGLPFGSEAFVRSAGTTAIFVAAISWSVAQVPYPAGSPSSSFADGDRHYGIAVYPAAALGAPWKPGPTAIAEYSIPTPSAQTTGITAGPDGAVWFTEYNGNKIGRITTSGGITEYPIPTPSSLPANIAAGPDGALWFTEFLGNKIGRISTAGRLTEYPMPRAGSRPFAITAGPDGAMWFTEENNAYIGSNKIGRITTAGRISEYAGDPKGCGADAIAAGPDRALWVVDPPRKGGSFCDMIGRITTSGSFMEFPGLTVSVDETQGITAGPDGAMWFTVPWTFNGPTDMICRITTAGIITEFPVETYSLPADIASGPDGALWFTQMEEGWIGRITTAGIVTEYRIPTDGSNPLGITAGPDGTVWFTEEYTNKIGRIKL